MLLREAGLSAVVILNPYANRWKAGQRQEEAVTALREAEVKTVLGLTERPGDATEIAYQAAIQGSSPILVAGGDGSINEVINGLVRAADDRE